MSPKENQGDGGCVTVEYSTEEKQELYDVGDEEEEGKTSSDMYAGQGTGIYWVFQELFDK